MGFFATLSQSWKEYKLNFKTIFAIMLLLYVLPTIIGYSISVGYGSTLINKNTPDNLGYDPSTLYSNLIPYLIAIAIVGVAVFLLNYLAYISILASSFNKKSWQFKRSISEGKKVFWKLLGLFIVWSILILLLSLPAIIFTTAFLYHATMASLGRIDLTPVNTNLAFLIISPILLILPLYFLISLLFASYILVDKKTSIFESLKQSRLLVKGKWWKTLGYFILFGIFSILLSIIFSIPSIITPMVIANNPIISNLVKILFDLVLSIILYPLTIIFFKNFYLNLKK